MRRRKLQVRTDWGGPLRDGEDGFSDAGVGIQAPPRRESWLRRWRWVVMAAGPLAILAAVAWFVIHSGRIESTDNAYVQAEKVPVSAAIGGRVVEVNVRENQHVKKGEVLFRLDARDLEAAHAAAQAELDSTYTMVRSARATYRERQATVAAAQANAAHLAREAERQRQLAAAGAASAQQYAEARNLADQATQQLTVARAQADVALVNIGGDPNLPMEAMARVREARANTELARLRTTYTEVVAPKDGVVTRVQQLQVGGYVNAAQTVFWLISGVPWVEANFKEDQLGKMRVGQPATIRIDAYRDQVLKGHVASFSPGTGSAFSALPAQNATGNWVKVVQRLPVQIAFDQPPPDMAGRLGLSAVVKVQVRPPKER